jgi:hypothetical protein
VPTGTRDLASHVLWERSLERSRRRRVLAEAARKQLARRKTASVAMSAAVAAAPIAPSVAAAASMSKETTARVARKLEKQHVNRVLLEKGDSSTAVVELQRALRIPDDGIYGKQTAWAVETFQQREGLDPTGTVDVKTWLKLFPGDAVIYVAPAAAKALGAQTSGPSWTAVNAAELQQAQTKLAAQISSAQGGDAQAHHAKRHHATIASAAKDLPKHAGDPGHQKPSGTDISSPGGARAHHVAPLPSTGTLGGSGHQQAPSSPPVVHHAPKSQPFTAPKMPNGSAGDIIKALIAAANRIDSKHYAYSWGGGHNASFSGPYDCSGAVSAVLHAAGLLSHPMVSGDFMHWGAPGKGAVTIYANAGHVYMSIMGHFFGTSGANPGGGAGWFNGAPRPGFAVVHVPLERLHMKWASSSRKKAKRARAARVKARRHHRHTTATWSANGGTQATKADTASSNPGPQASPSEPQPAAQTSPQAPVANTAPVDSVTPIASAPKAAAPQSAVTPQAAPAQPQAQVQQQAPVQPQAQVQPQAAPVQPQAQVQPQAAPVQPQAPAQPQAQVQPQAPVQQAPAQPQAQVQPQQQAPAQPQAQVQPAAPAAPKAPSSAAPAAPAQPQASTPAPAPKPAAPAQPAQASTPAPAPAAAAPQQAAGAGQAAAKSATKPAAASADSNG